MNYATITLILGVIGCVVGVSTFVSGRMAKAEHNGAIEAKINQAIDGISSINRKLEALSNGQHSIDLMVRSHDEQIKTLFRQDSELRTTILEMDRTNEVLTELLHTMQKYSN